MTNLYPVNTSESRSIKCWLGLSQLSPTSKIDITTAIHILLIAAIIVAVTQNLIIFKIEYHKCDLATNNFQVHRRFFQTSVGDP